jgi:hypothetical protein
MQAKLLQLERCLIRARYASGDMSMVKYFIDMALAEVDDEINRSASGLDISHGECLTRHRAERDNSVVTTSKTTCRTA